MAISIKSFEQELVNTKEKSRNFPRDINFSFSATGKELRSELTGKISKNDFRGFEPWTLACIVEAKQKTGIDVSKVIFAVAKPQKTDRSFDLNFESFRRRLSFLSINNPAIKFELELNGNKVILDDKKALFNRPANEIIRSEISEHSEENNPKFLEKAFQSFLYGKELEIRTNERLAILGEDFYKMKGKDVGILREFPTGVFNEKIADATRIMPTEFVDLITLNKWGNLAVLELKVDNSVLEVISQILDYGLFFACYRNLIAEIPVIKNTFNTKQIEKDDIFCYVVNNRFHLRFDGIMPFYSTKNKSYGFCFRKVILGETSEI